MSKKRSPRKAKPSTALVPAATAAVAVVQPSGARTIVEKLIELASNPGLDVAKIDALISANERVIAIGAKQQFDEAFALMQAEMPVITKQGLAVVTSKEDSTKIVRRTPYARDVDITIAIRPILARHGFALRHRNAMADGKLVVTGILSHRGGHREEDTFGPVGADDSGRKNPMQSWASARSYGKRYTTIALCNISSEDQQDGEDDGEGAGVFDEYPSTPPRPVPPPARSTVPSDTAVISDPQRKRLWTILRNSGRDEQSVRDWLFKTYQIDSSKKIQRRHYDAVCNAIEAPGKLPGTREPGEEG